MKRMKEILARLFALWAIFWFIITLLLVFFPVWMTGLWKEPKRTAILLAIFRIWMRIYFPLIGMRLRVKGKEHFQKGRSYIVVCNHNSLMDVPVSTPAIPGANKTIAKIEMTRLPLFGMIYKRGSVLVDRRNEESRKASYAKMKEVLDAGMHMCIYPEGTRNKTVEPLQKFHDGAFRLAVDSRHAILPAVIFNTAKILPPQKSFYYWPGRAEIHFLPPVEPDNLSVAELKEKIFTLMQDYYLRHSN
jgi:1-acyl-sn-glycerol-3-phosphate acyltransferase